MRNKKRFILSCLVIFLFLLLTLTDALAIKTFYQGSINKEPEEMEFIARKYEYVIATAGPSHVQELKNYNPDLKVLYYFNAKGVHTYHPYWNEVVDAGLLWKDENGNPIKNIKHGWYLVDIRSPVWTDIAINYLSEKMSYYDGIALDEVGILYPENLTNLPYDYNQDEFYSSLILFVQNLKQQFPNKTIIFNGYRRVSGYKGMKILSHADGLSFEGFSYRFNGSYIGKEALRNELIDFFIATHYKHKVAYFIDMGKSTDYEKRMFSLAAYLLVSNEDSIYLYIDPSIAGSQFYPEFRLNLGKPTTFPYETKKGFFVRYYEKGVALINPNENKTLEIDLGNRHLKRLVLEGGGNWDNEGDIYLEDVTGIIKVPPVTGIIFMW